MPQSYTHDRDDVSSGLRKVRSDVECKPPGRSWTSLAPRIAFLFYLKAALRRPVLFGYRPTSNDGSGFQSYQCAVHYWIQYNVVLHRSVEQVLSESCLILLDPHRQEQRRHMQAESHRHRTGDQSLHCTSFSCSKCAGGENQLATKSSKL